MKHYDKLKSVIQAANPERFNDKLSNQLKAIALGSSEPLSYVIRLADVLLAMPKEKTAKYVVSVDESIDGKEAVFGEVYKGNLELDDDISVNWGFAYWNLKDDNLDHQSEEMKQFLIDLLAND